MDAKLMVIDADPRPGYEPHMKDAKFLPKFRFRVWLDRSREAVGETRHSMHRHSFGGPVSAAAAQRVEHSDRTGAGE